MSENIAGVSSRARPCLSFFGEFNWKLTSSLPPKLPFPPLEVRQRCRKSANMELAAAPALFKLRSASVREQGLRDPFTCFATALPRCPGCAIQRATSRNEPPAPLQPRTGRVRRASRAALEPPDPGRRLANRAFRLCAAARIGMSVVRCAPRPFYLPTLLFNYFAALSRLAAA